MKFSAQNLNESKGKIIGSIFWRGRAWFRNHKTYDEFLHIEWLFGKYARDFALTASVGYDDSNSGVCLHICLPWLFSLYFVLPHVYGPIREYKTGVGIHNGSAWLYPWVDAMESRSDWPWWKKAYCWNFPWTYDWYKTEVLDNNFNTIWSEQKGHRGDAFDSLDSKRNAAATVTTVYPYQYTLKNGTVQERTAAIHIERMTWRMKWWPLIPIKKARTSINIAFSQEVGEKTGSWKGGCTGCGYDMLPGETKHQTLIRMESERKF